MSTVAKEGLTSYEAVCEEQMRTWGMGERHVPHYMLDGTLLHNQLVQHEALRGGVTCCGCSFGCQGTGSQEQNGADVGSEGAAAAE